MKYTMIKVCNEINLFFYSKHFINNIQNELFNVYIIWTYETFFF